MIRKVYNFWGDELDSKKTPEKVFYVNCDCGHLAIRKNNTSLEIFKCSLCKKEYMMRKFGRIKLIK